MAGIHRRRLTLAARRNSDFPSDRVFVNCPFDRAHEEVFDAIIFALFYCGLQPITAASREADSEPWLDYIIRQLQSCRCSVHDITPVLGSQGESRSNMVFELGVAFGGGRRDGAFILIADRSLLAGGFSDLDGIELTNYADGKSDKGATIVRRLTQWLVKKPDFTGKPLPKPGEAQSVYEKKFRRHFRAFCQKQGWASGDKLSYKVELIGEWVAAHRAGKARRISAVGRLSHKSARRG